MKGKERNKEHQTEPDSFRVFLRKKIIKALILIIIASILGTGLFLLEQIHRHNQWERPPLEPPSESGIQAAIHFYGKDVEKLSQKYNLPYSYLMALIMLESSGRRNPHARFERNVYLKLKAVRDGRLSHYENITRKDLQGMSDHQLRDLAKSWGPFQIMGYKSLKMGITVQDLHNYKALENGIKWINQEYGDLLRQGRYKDAFHYHNTGHIIPPSGKNYTTDPYYVEKGIQYMKIFEQLSKTKTKSK